MIFFSFLIGQEPAGNSQTTAVKKTDASKKKKTMEEALKGKEAIEGLFTLYQGKEDGKLHMLIKSEQLKRLNEDKDFSHLKAKKLIGYDPMSFAEGIQKEIFIYKNKSQEH